ncbi:hypothetical protein ACFLUZ_05420 [Chloroflexota bacterium]
MCLKTTSVMLCADLNYQRIMLPGLIKGRLDELPPGSRIGADSLRRVVQLRSYRPDLKIGSIRGNVDTRLRKVAQGGV